MADDNMHDLTDEALCRLIARALKSGARARGSWTQQCLPAPRLWAIALNKTDPTEAESHHLNSCDRCVGLLAEIGSAVHANAIVQESHVLATQGTAEPLITIPCSVVTEIVRALDIMDPPAMHQYLQPYRKVLLAAAQGQDVSTTELKPPEQPVPVSISQSLERRPLRSASRSVAAAYSAFRAHWTHVAVAASIALICGVMLYGQSKTYAKTIDQFSEMLRSANATIQELVRKLSQSGAGREVPVPSNTEFQSEFERAGRYQPRAYDNQPKLGLVFYPFIGPPYYTSVRATWNGDHSQWIYRANFVPLEPEVFLNFADLVPASGEKRITLTLEFNTTGEAMRKLVVAPMIKKIMPLILSSKGVRIASAEDQKFVTASIVAPRDAENVDDQFTLEMTLQRPASASVEKNDLNRMVHVLIRPTDGDADRNHQYYVVPFRKRVDELSEKGEKYIFPISLGGILGMRSAERQPTRFEILVVDVPFQLEGWTVGKNVLDFDLPDTKNMLRDHVKVSLRPERSDSEIVPNPDSES